MRWATSILAGSVAALLALGAVVLYSAQMGPKAEYYLLSQVVAGGIGLVCCVLATTVDYRWLRKIWWVLLIVAIILLVMVLVPALGGVRSKGASRWVRFHGFQFQPSEIAKVALIVFLAHYGTLRQRYLPSFFKGLIPAGVVVAMVLGLIFKEPDWGTTILLATVSCVMLVLAGARWWHFILPGALALTLLGWLLINNPVRLERVKAYLDQEASKEGVGYQAYQAKIALGAGGWLGLGLGNGRQKMGFVPEHHTDFILSVIGEEIGLAATLGVLAAFVAIILSGSYIARHARDHFGFLLASGITLLIGFQALINIGVVTSVLPNKGLPLPFISYGGSNLLTMLGFVGILLSVARHAELAPVDEDGNVQEDPSPASVPF